MSAMTLFIIVLILGIVCRKIVGNCGGGIAAIVNVAGLLMIAFGAYGIITALV